MGLSVGNRSWHFLPKLKVSLETVVSDSAHQVTTDLKELHQYLHNKSSHAIKQYEVHSASQHLLIPPFQVRDTIWLDSCNIWTHDPQRSWTITSWDHSWLYRRSHLTCSDLVCPSHSHASTWCSMFHCCNPLVLVRSWTELLTHHHWLSLMMLTHGRSIRSWIVQIDHSQKGSSFLYLVEWKGFNNTPEATSWEPPEPLENAANWVKAFHQAYPTKAAPLSLKGATHVFSPTYHTMIDFKNKHFLHHSLGCFYPLFTVCMNTLVLLIFPDNLVYVHFCA